MGHGELIEGDLVIELDTSQPAPFHWVAIGRVSDEPLPWPAGAPQRLVVGTGRTEEEAIADLRVRVRIPRALVEQQFATEWVCG